MTTDITTTDAWAKVEQAQQSLAQKTLRELFDADPQRGEKLSFDAADLHVDLSKNLVDDSIRDALIELAQTAGLPERIEAMFRGDKINNTENRSVLHTALRLPVTEDLVVDGQDVAADVHEVLSRMRDFATSLRSGAWLGYTGHTIKTVVNIGIGG